ncbi:MAG TPA: TolC family protein [Bryobacteraceae bacterium]|nr:TolC family protein [Bryobacteraceae bacterium]
MNRLTLLTLVPLAFALAQDPAKSPAPLPTMRSVPDPATPARVGVGITQRQLSLQEAIGMALANNLDLEIERTAVATAEQNVAAARGFFDPVFRWTPLFENRNTPVANVFQGAGGKVNDRFFSTNFNLQQRFTRWGTTGNAGFTNLRTTTTNPFANFNPTLTSQLAFNITQPLLRGLRIDRDRAELRIRQKRVNQSSVDLEARAIDVISRVEQAYYDLVGARSAVGVAEEAVAWGREQLALNQRLVKAGTLAPVEISAAEAEVQRRIDTWYSALGVVTEAENALKTLIAAESSASIWSDEIIPTDVDSRSPVADNLQEAVKVAIDSRPELRVLGVQREINSIEKELNADLRRPEVSLIGQYAMNGLAGSISSAPNPLANLNGPLNNRVNELSTQLGLAPLQPVSFGGPPEFLVGGYGSAISNLFGGRYQTVQVGAQIDFNLRNRTAGANYGQTLINEKRLRLERIRAEQNIQAQVRNALQGIETARQRIQAAEASARAAKDKLDSEIRLYQTGESTNFLVLTRQNEYSDSRRRAVVARLDYNKSIARLNQAMGATLSSNKVTFR